MYYDKTDIREGIDSTKSNRSKGCMIWYYSFSNQGFKFQDSVCNDCHDLLMLIVGIKDIAIITVKNFDYRCIIHEVSKCEAINLFENFTLVGCGCM